MGSKEALYACMALSLAAAGLVVDLRSGRPEPAAGTRTTPASPVRFHEGAVFCPGMERPEASGRSVSRVLSVHTPAGTRAEVVVRPWIRRSSVVEGRTLRLFGVPQRAATVVGLGGRVTAASLVQWPGSLQEGRRRGAWQGGAGASGCSPVASDRWYFPAGASSAGWDERISIVNPFPDEAVARVTFAAGRGAKDLSPHELAVPARSSAQVVVNRLALPEPSLAATVSILRGRVAAWKTVFRIPGLERPSRRLTRLTRVPPAGPGPGGALFSLGATTTSSRWYFPEAGAGPGRTTTLALLNPSERPASVTVSLLGREAIAQPAGLVDVPVPAGGSRALTLEVPSTLRGRVRSFGAVVASSNGSEVVAERVMSYQSRRLEGVASEIGAPRPARRWSLAPAAARPREDDVIVLNPGSRDAVVDLELLRPSRPGVAPARLQNVVVPAGGRRTFSIAADQRGRGAVVLLRASAPVVAERRAYSAPQRDVASIMGTALPLGARMIVPGG